MKRLLFSLGLIVIFLIAMPEKATAQFFVRIRPVAPVVVGVIPPAPGPHYVWVKGHWRWNKHRNEYVWVEGHWIQARRGHVWVEGYWEDVEGRGSRWIPGHWSR